MEPRLDPRRTFVLSAPNRELIARQSEVNHIVDVGDPRGLLTSVAQAAAAAANDPTHREHHHHNAISR
jgi:hypothetical protein